MQLKKLTCFHDAMIRFGWLFALYISVCGCGDNSTQLFYKYSAEIEFGTVEAGSTLFQQLVVKNPYGIELSINDLYSTCSCAEVRPKKNEIGIGGELVFDVRYSSAQKAVDDRKKILVGFDQNVPPFEIYVSASVRPKLFVSPEIIEEKAVVAGRDIRGQFSVLSFCDVTFRGLVVETSVPWVTAQVREKDFEASFSECTQSWFVEYRVKPPQGIKECFSVTIDVLPVLAVGQFTDEIPQQLSFSAQYRFLKSFSISPPVVVFNRVEKEMSTKETLSVFLPNEGSDTVEDLEIESSSKSLSWVVHKVDEKYARIELLFQPSNLEQQSVGRIEECIFLKLASDPDSNVRVGCVAYVR